MSDNDMERFGWGCYWKNKKKNDEIEVLKQIILNSTDDNAKEQLKNYQLIINQKRAEAEARKIKKLAQNINNGLKYPIVL